MQLSSQAHQHNTACSKITLSKNNNHNGMLLDIKVTTKEKNKSLENPLIS